MFAKKGISPVIATVLLLLLTIVAVSILTYFVVPFLNGNLENSGDCFDLLNKVSLEENSYTCYTYLSSGSTQGRTAFSLRVDYEEPVQVKVLLYKPGRTSADNMILRDGANYSTLRMLDQDFSQTLDLPYKGAVRTYVLSDVYEQIEVNPVLSSGKVCNEQRSIRLQPCVNSAVIGNLTRY